MKQDMGLAGVVPPKAGRPAGPKPPVWYGEVLQKARESLGLTREQLAERSDVDAVTILRNETGMPARSVKGSTRVRNALVSLGRQVPPVPSDEDAPPPTAPTAPRIAVDSEAETIRRNLVAARDTLGYDLHDVNSITGIPFDTLRAYELGELAISGLHLKALAKLYGYKMDDITEEKMPPPDPAARQVIHMRTDPGALEILSGDERDRLERLKQEIAALNASARKRLADASAADKRPKRR